jgi:hypothetical protein
MRNLVYLSAVGDSTKRQASGSGEGPKGRGKKAKAAEPQDEKERALAEEAKVCVHRSSIGRQSTSAATTTATSPGTCRGKGTF